MRSVKKLFFFLILKGVFGLFWGCGGEGGGDGGEVMAEMKQLYAKCQETLLFSYT